MELKFLNSYKRIHSEKLEQSAHFLNTKWKSRPFGGKTQKAKVVMTAPKTFGTKSRSCDQAVGTRPAFLLSGLRS